MIFSTNLVLSLLAASSASAFMIQTESRKTMAPTFSYLGSLGDAPRATNQGGDVQTARGGPHFASVEDSRVVSFNPHALQHSWVSR